VDELTLSIGVGHGSVARSSVGDVPDAARTTSQSADRPVPALEADNGGLRADRGSLRRGSLRFVDAQLERDYQRQGGAESRNGYLITTGAAAIMWLLAAVVIPSGTPIPLDRAMTVAITMALLNWVAFLFAETADTLDRQHLIISVLTSINGVVILLLASTGGILPGYGISAIMLLLAFGFVARTGFPFAAWRSVVIVVGFVIVAVLYPNRASLLVDAFIFSAALMVSLLALRRLEQSRRRVFYQDVVITKQSAALRLEKDRADALLLNVLPESISSRLLAGELTIADAYPAVTVLFADIVGFTSLTARLPAADVVRMLDRLFARFDELVAERGLEKIKTIGDAYMAAGGLTEPLVDHAARVVDLGLAMIEAASRESDGIGELQLRVGVHSGPVIGGVIGHQKFAFDIWGETVNISSRLESQGIPGRLQVSARTWRDVKDLFEADQRGPIRVRGYGLIETYLVVGRRGRDRRNGHQNPATLEQSASPIDGIPRKRSASEP
jgi:class 3 adenylate cyclase